MGALEGHEACLRYIKECGCSIDVQANGCLQDNDGWTPAHCAAASGHEACLRYIQECGFSLEVQMTPADDAAFSGHEPLLRNINSQANNGRRCRRCCAIL